MMLNHPSRAVSAVRFLIAGSQKHDIPRRDDAELLQQDQRGQLNDARAFHIKRAAPPHDSVSDLRPKRIFRPPRRIYRNHIHMVQQQERTLRAIPAGQSHQQIRSAARSAFVQLRFYCCCGKLSRKQLSRRARIRRWID